MKKRAWIGEVPTIFSACLGAYFGLSGGHYTGPPGALETTYFWLAIAFGLANIALIITTTILITSMRTNEKWQLLLDASRARLERERQTSGVV